MFYKLPKPPNEMIILIGLYCIYKNNKNMNTFKTKNDYKTK